MAKIRVLTPAEIDIATATIAAWPFAAWFAPRVVWDYNGPGQNGRYNYIELDHIAGPSGPGFMIGGNSDGSHGVTYSPVNGDGPLELGPFGEIKDAIKAVEDCILEDVTGWNLQVAS